MRWGEGGGLKIKETFYLPSSLVVQNTVFPTVSIYTTVCLCPQGQEQEGTTCRSRRKAPSGATWLSKGSSGDL